MGDVDLAEAEPARAPVAALALGDDADVGDLAGGGGVVGVGRARSRRRGRRGRATRPARCRPGARRPRPRGRWRGRSTASTCRSPGRSRSRPAATGLPPAERMSVRSAARRRSVQNQPRGRRRSRPSSTSASSSAARGRAEQRAGRRRSAASSWAAAHRWGPSTCGLAGVEDGRLDRLAEQRLGMGDQVGVQRVVARHQDRRARPVAAAGPADLLPHRGAGAGEAGQQHGVEPADVDAELERVGGRQPDQLAGAQGRARCRGAPRAGSRRGTPPPGPAAPGRRRRAARPRVSATCSAPRRERTNASVRTPSATRSASRSAVSDEAARRTGAPCSPVRR